MESEFRPGVVAVKIHSTMVEWATLAALVLILLAAGVQYNFLSTTARYQKDAEQRGYVNRAAICEIQRDLGIKLAGACLDPRVTAYYDPKAVHTANGAAIRRMVCQLMAKTPSDTREVDCAGTGVP
jgi:hypothetical protein